jgi:hypothetical protein
MRFLRERSLGLCPYCLLARQAKGAVPNGRQALQEMHSDLSGPAPERQKLGRSGWRIKGLHIETKSATFESKTFSILLNDRSPPTRMIEAYVFSFSALAPC